MNDGSIKIPKINKRHIFYVLACVMMAVTLSACQTTAKPVAKPNVALAQTRTALAQQYFAQGQLDTAKRQLDLAMAADAHYAPAYRLLAQLYQAEGSARSLALAQQYFKQALDLDDGDMTSHESYGKFLVQIGQLDAAVLHFERAADSLGYIGRISALENLAYVRYLQWQREPTPKTRQRAILAIERAHHAGSQQVQMQAALGELQQSR